MNSSDAGINTHLLAFEEEQQRTLAKIEKDPKVLGEIQRSAIVEHAHLGYLASLGFV